MKRNIFTDFSKITQKDKQRIPFLVNLHIASLKKKFM